MVDFSSFVGNRRIIDHLFGKLEQGRLPHALIFAGPKGVGKRTLALILAKALNCRVGTAGFCGRCSQCHKIDIGTHPDVDLVAPGESAAQIKVSQVRQVLARMDFKPFEGTHRISVIDPAEKMTPEAANALLKALEEPPPNTFFILIAGSVHDLLVTVRSRCHAYHFVPLRLEDIRGSGIEDEFVARWSDGSIGRAVTMDGDAVRAERDAMLDFVELAANAHPESYSELLAGSADISRSREEFPDRLRIVGTIVADLLYLKLGLPERVTNADVRLRLDRLAELLSLDRLIAIRDGLSQAELSLRRYANRHMLADVLALTMNDAASKILHDNQPETL